jgi:nitrite reductase/ring-hydroxylating ferredoxin subunit
MLRAFFLYPTGRPNGGIRDGRQWAECGARLRPGRRAAGIGESLYGRAEYAAVYNIDGTYYITDDECTHAAASLADGMLEGDVIECCMHMGSFHVPTGNVIAPPCEVPLRTYKVVLEGDGVLVDLAHNAAGEPQ